MDEWNAERAKGYPHTDTSERSAVALFEYLINKNRIKGKVEVSDKIPNIDGVLSLFGEDGKEPISTIEIQVKSRPSDISNSKSQIDLSLFHYAIYKTNNPVFFIGVDINNEKIYWLYITNELLEMRKKPLNDNQQSVVINLKFNNIFDGLIDIENEKYLERWIDLSKSHYSRLPGYIELERKYLELVQSIDLTLKSGPNLDYINNFLSITNKLLNKFKIIKNRFYPGSLRIGFAYNKFTSNELAYTLYPIFGEQDLNIKIVHEELIRQIFDGKQNFTDFFKIHYRSNPIIENSKDYAIEFIRERTNRILKDRALWNYNDFLANEVVYAFTSRYHRLLGLENESYYTIDKIKESFEKMDKSSIYELIISTNFASNIYVDLLEYLDFKGVETVNNVYFDNFIFHQDESGSWVEGSFENVVKNWNLIVDNVYAVYTELIKLNFPEIEKDLPIFKGSKNVLFTFFPYDRFRYGANSATYNIVGYNDKNTDFKLNFKLYGEGEDPEINLIDYTYNVNGTNYDINYYKYSGYLFTELDFTPMLNFVYGLIKESTDRYFREN